MYDNDFIVLMDCKFNIEDEYKSFHKIYCCFIELSNILEPIEKTVKCFNGKNKTIEQRKNNIAVDIVKIMIYMFENIDEGYNVCKDLIYKIYNIKMIIEIKKVLLKFLNKNKNSLIICKLTEIIDYCNKL